MAFEKRILADGRAVLYRGDCLELLAAGLLKADAIVTDPPYGIGFQHGGKAPGRNVNDNSVIRNKEKIIGDDAEFDPLPWVSAAPRTEVKNTVYGGEPRIVLFGAPVAQASSLPRRADQNNEQAGSLRYSGAAP